MTQQNIQAHIEHINLSAIDPDNTARQLCDLFDWSIRWSGASMDDGYTVHVGSPSSYIAIYKNDHLISNTQRSHNTIHNLNHIGVVVEDLSSIEEKAKGLGLEPFNYRDYGPCDSFYCYLEDGLEIEIISYKNKPESTR